MNQRTIELSNIDPAAFFGIDERNLNLFKKCFPSLKIVARGNQIKVYGAAHFLEVFETRIQRVINYFNNYNHINQSTVERLLLTDTQPNSNSKQEAILVHGVAGSFVRAKTLGQKKMVQAILKNDLLFALGPAGTGKTYIAIALAVQFLKNKQVKRIILTRPAVESGENLGFLPGDIKEKLDPYVQPLYDALRDMIPAEKLSYFLEKGILQVVPLAFMRGRTLDRAFVILDEAQNTTESQMKMFLTRMGKDAKFIVTGDPQQVDLPKKQPSGLSNAIATLKNIAGISFVFLDEKDMVRHALVKEIIGAYQKQI